MKHFDRLHLEMPFAGAHMLRDLLAPEGFQIGRKHVSTLMKRMAIEALYRKPAPRPSTHSIERIRICCAA